MPDPITDIQTRLAFHEHTIDQLNAVILQQQKRIEDLERRLQRLADRVKAEPLVRDTAEEEPPPHY